MKKISSLAVLFLTLALAACGLPFQGGRSQPTPAQSGTRLFQDDFSNPQSGWATNSSAHGSIGYVDGGYRIEVTTAGYEKAASLPKVFQNDVRIEVNAIKQAGPVDGSIGILCRYQDASNFYAGIVSGNGTEIVKVVNGQRTALDAESNTDALVSGADNNTLRFTCIGNSLILYANGDQVAGATDSSFSGGMVGLLAGAYDTGGVSILFKNF